MARRSRYTKLVVPLALVAAVCRAEPPDVQAEEQMANDAAHIAAAAFPAEEIRFGIAKQDVSEALIEFGEQAGLTVLVHQDVIGITSPGVDGEFGIVEALDSLLADTGLDYRMKGEAIIV